MVYVDNVIHGIALALEAPADRVAGETFAISDGDPITWYDFYRYFADAMGVDAASIQTMPTDNRMQGRGLLGAVRTIVTSPEFKKLGRRVLDTDPIGTLPRRLLEKFPASERAVRQLIRADDSLPVYRREPAAAAEIVVMGSGGALVSIAKLRRVLGFEPPVTISAGLDLTLRWASASRLISTRSSS